MHYKYNLSFFYWLFIIADGILSANIILTIFQYSVFIGIFAKTYIMLIVFDLQRIIRTLKQYCEKINKNLFLIIPNKDLLLLYLQNTNILINISLAFDLWGKVLFIYFLISIPINATTILTIVIVELDFYDQIILYLIVFYHTTIIIYFLVGCSKVTNAIHYCDRFLVKIVKEIDRDIQLKIKYDHWLQLLLFGEKYGPCIFTIGTLSHSLILKVKLIN